MVEAKEMKGAILIPGGRKVELKSFDIPEPGHGEVLIKVKASSICGSDLRGIYRNYEGRPEERYNDVICGHEPAGQIVEVGPGVKRFKSGDRVALYHVSGCGVCRDCREGNMISCEAPEPERAAYGWQRNGGMAEYLVADEKTCILIPDGLSYIDGAIVSCGFGTAYEAIINCNASGDDRILITGLGPVGLAVGMIARAIGAKQVIGVDISEDRAALAREIGAVTDTVVGGGDEALEKIMELTGGTGCELTYDCSGATPARELALKSTRRWGTCGLVGAGGRLDVDFDDVGILFKSLTIKSRWVTTVGHMEDLMEKLVLWGIRPEDTVTDTFSLDEVDEAFRVADEGKGGKVSVVM